MGSPLDYNFDDLVNVDSDNGKLKCWKSMSLARDGGFLLFFLLAVAGAFLLPMEPLDAIKTTNSYIAPTPLKSKPIDISQFALNYLVYLTESKA